MSDSRSKMQKYSAPALEKGLDILEFLSVTDTRPSLSQLAAGIGRSKSEIFRMMIVLEERGYIQRTDRDQFELTDRLALIGGQRSQTGKLAEMAGPYLEKLTDETNLSSNLAVRNADGLVVIASTVATQNYGLSVLVGYQMTLFGTAAGASILSTMGTKARDETLASLTENTEPALKATFLESIDSCAQKGFAALPSPESNFILEVSVPIQHTPSQATIATMTVPIFDSASKGNRKDLIVGSLLSIARQLEEKIAITLPAPRIGAGNV